jgi:hypothetical protein
MIRYFHLVDLLLTDVLKVLNGTITSPPDTPPTQQNFFQSGPREPAFSASTYKPPALYPNKKARTEFGLDPSPTFNSRSSLSSPGMPTTTLETRPERMTVSYGHSRPYSDHESTRRPSMYQVPTLRQEHTSPPDAVNYQYTRGFADDSRSRANGVTATAPHRSPEAAPFLSSRSEAPYGHSTMTQSRGSADYFPSSTDRYAIPTSRRSSVVSQREFAPPRPVEPSRNAYPPTRPTHYSLPMRDEAAPSHDHPQYTERNRLQQQDAYAKMGGYQDAQPTFFMPSHYDYQQGKTRKRSNLPKQSTEIMKTWFDQVNIHTVVVKGSKS